MKRRSGPSQFWILALAVVLMAICGCHRAFYRKQADAEAYALVDQKASDPRWQLPGYTIAIDPRSRMYDPYNPDCEPMPSDDPASHQLMHCIDDKKGYPFWHDDGDTPYSENPAWLAGLPLDKDGRLVVDADSSVRLALLHSPDYQEELEELYLSALDVSFERFRFDTQFFAGYGVFFTADGRNRPGSGGQSRSELELTTLPGQNIQATRLFTTGAELVVNLANSLLWQFSGPDTDSVNTLLDFSLVQPLLRGAGRDRIMERLTFSERTLLANVRQMEQFRRGFYVEIVTGEDAGQGPSRLGGFFGGSGLEGFTGVGGGGFGRVGGFGGGFAGAGFEAAGAGAGLAGGFFGLLQVQQSIRNQESTIASLRNSLSQIEAFYAAGRIDFLQVQQARQALFTAQSQLLISRNGYQTSLDRFKVDLGLPPQVDLAIDDSFVQPFDLVDNAMVSVQNMLTNLQQAVGNTILQMAGNQQADGQAAPQPQKWTAQMAEGLRQLRVQVADAERIRAQVVQTNVPRAWRDIDRLKEALSRRRQAIQSLSRRLRAQTGGNGSAVDQDETREGDVDLGIMNLEELEQLPAQLEAMLADLLIRLEDSAKELTGFEKAIDTLLQEGPNLDPDVLRGRLQEQIMAPVPSALTELSAQTLELLLVQARARTESTTLVPLELDAGEALETARVNRRDWMNARASLVDAWRRIAFNADELESGLDVVFSGDIRNVGDNPLDLRGSTGRLRVGLEFDAPLTRLAERNNYRQALIEYQQARRDYYQFVDRLARDLRDTIRTIELNQMNFELRRAAVLVAIAQVELARLRLQEPPQPGVVEALFGPTTANDLVQALSNLLTAQNDFLSVFINYEVQRRTLDFGLGTMQLDPDGVWIDPGPIGPSDPLPPTDAGPEAVEGGIPVHPVQNRRAITDYRGLPFSRTIPSAPRHYEKTSRPSVRIKPPRNYLPTSIDDPTSQSGHRRAGNDQNNPRRLPKTDSGQSDHLSALAPPRSNAGSK